MGGGHVDLKLRVNFDEFVSACHAVVASVTVPKTDDPTQVPAHACACAVDMQHGPALGMRASAHRTGQA